MFVQSEDFRFGKRRGFRASATAVFFKLAGAPLLLFLLLPPLALVWKGTGKLASALHNPDTLQAVGVSLRTTSCSLLILLLLGTPLAAWIVRPGAPYLRVIESIIELPLVLPPAAAGIGLLLAFGREGLIRTHLPFSVGAVIVSQVFVAAPLYVRAASGGFAASSADLLELSKLEGASPWTKFFRITLPIGAPMFLGAAAMGWARALGEFGATMLFAGSLSGRTETLPLAIYFGFESNLDEAIGISVLLLIIAAIVLIVARVLATPIALMDPGISGNTR